MANNMYIGTDIAICDLSVENYRTVAQLASSEGFRAFMEGYFKDLAVREISTYSWLTNSRGLNELLDDTILLAKQLLVLDVKEIYVNNLNSLNVTKALFIVEDACNYWRKKQRFSIVFNNNGMMTHDAFIELDTRYGQLIMQLYRICQEKLQGKQNHIYRQVQAGANAAFVLKNYKWNNSIYPILKSIPFIETVILRTPILFHPFLSEMEHNIVAAETNPVKSLKMIPSDWACYPLKVGGLICFVFFHKDFAGSIAALANLFELANEEECKDITPDLICIYGKQDDRENTEYYFDKDNGVWIASVSYDNRMKYLSYLKNTILLLHNMAKIKKDELPVHGSMVEITFFDGKKKTLAIIGDSGTGKSETIEAIRRLNNADSTEKRIIEIRTVFDDMGTFLISNGIVVAHGTETGAFVRLNGLDETNSYHDMERSIFLNPENKEARVVLPIAPYETINRDYPVDIVVYANNYEDKAGIDQITDFDQIIDVFQQGKYKKNVNDSVSSTFFANSYGPVQMKEKCGTLLNEVFKCLYDNNVYIGQIYTHLSTENRDKITDTAKELIDLLQKE